MRKPMIGAQATQIKRPACPDYHVVGNCSPGMSEVAPPIVEHSPPARPLRCRTSLTVQGDTLVLNRRNGFDATVIFLMLWLTGWTAGCVMMLGKLISGFEWFFLLFATPFFVAEIVVAIMVSWMLFGRQRLTIGRDGIKTELRLFGFTKQSTSSLHRLRLAEEHSWASSNRRPIYGVRVKTTEGPLTFTYSCSDDERSWLLHTINAHIARLHGGTVPADDQATAGSEPGPLEARAEKSDRWHIEDQIRTVTLHTRGKTKLSLVAGMTAVCLFWNGIVSVFIAQLFLDRFEWFLFVFLIPFEVIGVAMILMWFGLLLASFTTRTWTIDRNELVRRYRSPLWRWTTRTPTHLLKRGHAERDPRPKAEGALVDESKGDWRIVLIDQDDAQIAILRPLTQVQAQAFLKAIQNRFFK